jgi:hypothetical protein
MLRRHPALLRLKMKGRARIALFLLALFADLMNFQAI